MTFDSHSNPVYLAIYHDYIYPHQIIDSRGNVYPYLSRVDNKDGSVDLKISITSKHWLGRLLLRAGDGVKVLKPVDYKNLASQTAQNVLARYQKSQSPS